MYELYYMVTSALILMWFMGYVQTETRTVDVPWFSYVKTTSFSPNYTTYSDRRIAYPWI